MAERKKREKQQELLEKEQRIAKLVAIVNQSKDNVQSDLKDKNETIDSRGYYSMPTSSIFTYDLTSE